MCHVCCGLYLKKSKRNEPILDAACKESKEKGCNIKEQVRLIGNKFTNNVEMSAQEAVDICLQVPLRKSSRQVIFIPTSEPDKRTYFLKSFQEIQSLEDDDEEVITANIITRYTNRPDSLENETLADWAAWYHNSSSMDTIENSQNGDDEAEEDNVVQCGKVHKRGKARWNATWPNMASAQHTAKKNSVSGKVGHGRKLRQRSKRLRWGFLSSV